MEYDFSAEKAFTYAGLPLQAGANGPYIQTVGGEAGELLQHHDPGAGRGGGPGGGAARDPCPDDGHVARDDGGFFV